MLKEFTDSSFSKSVVESKRPSVVMFWAQWDGPCRMVSPIIAELAKERKNVNIGRVDVDHCAKTSMKYNVRSIPRILFFKDGALTDQHMGVATKATLGEKIDKLVSSCEERLQDEVEYIAVTLVDGQVKFISLTKDGKYSFMDNKNHEHQLLYSIKFESRAILEAIEELEDLVNSNSTDERDLQEFFERHPDFIMGDEYKNAYAHVVLDRAEEGSLIPDFVLEPIIDNKLSDLLEIKLPKTKIYTLKKNRPKYSASVLEACAQLREYSYFFDERENREKILQDFGLEIFKPRMIVIIGRRGSFDPKVIRRVEMDLPKLKLETYDDIIDKMKFKVQ